MNSPIVAKHLPLIAEAMPHVAHVAVRNRGTIGGSIALADPSAEMPACVPALGITHDSAAAAPGVARMCSSKRAVQGQSLYSPSPPLLRADQYGPAIQ
jgi:FAD binding domain in molybdopterin dehydrogenase